MPLHFNRVSKKEKEGYRLNICFCIYCLVFLAYFAMCPNALQGYHGCWLLIGKLIKKPNGLSPLYPQKTVLGIFSFAWSFNLYS